MRALLFNPRLLNLNKNLNKFIKKLNMSGQNSYKYKKSLLIQHVINLIYFSLFAIISFFSLVMLSS